MKKTLLALLTLCLLLTAAPPAAAAGTGYSDVPDTCWAADSIRRATELGLFHGVDGQRFGLGQPITRAEFTSALVRLFGWESAAPAQASFADVAAGKWYYSAVETAKANGAVVACGSAFRPEAGISREEMTTMLVRSLGYAALAGAVSGCDAPFADLSTNRGFALVAYDLGLVNGVDATHFEPDAGATREQAAALLVRLYDRLYAENRLLSGETGGRIIRVETPSAAEGGELPTTPLEPIVRLYLKLRTLKSSGADMSASVLRLTAGGVRTLLSGKKIISSGEISAAEVEEVLTLPGARTYYSDRYESAYCIYQPNSYQSGTLWYQSEKSLAAKLMLARLFGVTDYVLEDAAEETP